MAHGTDEVNDVLLGIIQSLWEEYRQLNEKINSITKTIENYAKRNDHCKRVMKVAGVGALTATAVVAKYGTAQQFKNGQQLSAFLGLTP